MRRLGCLSARQNAAVKDAQRGEAGSLTAAGCCATHGEYGGKWNIPDQVDFYMEDGTVYHVRSFFTGDLLMGDVLDALTMEKLERAQ